LILPLINLIFIFNETCKNIWVSKWDKG
jgi:hypothetical protein